MSGTRPPTPWVAPVGVIDNFLPLELAARMREDIEAHFAAPDACLDTFIRALQTWSIVTLGMGNVIWPSLCLYVGGCRQARHNEAADGRFGFVYSLTRDQRRTVGGETL